MDEELTPLELSRATTGRRFFRANPTVYAQLSAAIDTARGYPEGVGTAAVTTRGLPEPGNLPTTENGDVLLSIEAWRVTAADEQMLAPAIAAGAVVELTADDYAESQIPKSEESLN